MTAAPFNHQKLLAHYEQIADAPDAVPRLRRFILDLAVRGKLAPQDAKDEPASELLKRIGREKARLVKAGEIRKPKALPAVALQDIPVGEVIPGWTWTRLGDVSTLITKGSTPTSYGHAYADTGVNFIKVETIRNGILQPENVSSFVSDSTHQFLARSQLAEGDVLFSIAGSIGTCAVVNEAILPANTNQALAIIRGTQTVFVSAFLLKALQSSVAGPVLEKARGGAMNNVSLDDIQNFVVPLPPLAEQRRIVAKVDELMGLCDRLEAAQGAREAVRDRLAAASLARLNAPDTKASPAKVGTGFASGDASENESTFQADARFALDALPALTTRPDQIKRLRQTILNLAVRGKLVPQDANDEPISATLDRAMARRAALVKAKKVRAKKLDGYGDLEADADLPSSWMLERLGSLVDPENTISYGVLVPGEEVPDGIPFVRAQDLALSGHPERPNKTIAPEIEKAYARTRLRGGEILVCVVGSIGKLGIVPPSWAGANIARAVARILPIPEISREYLLVVLRGEPVQTYFNETTRTLAQPTLNVGLIEQTPIPLPPLAEQHRIVAKVDALMALCDRLEASLDLTAATRRRLLDALLAETLAPVGDFSDDNIETIKQVLHA